MDEIKFVYDISEILNLAGSGCACLWTQDGTLYVAPKLVVIDPPV